MDGVALTSTNRAAPHRSQRLTSPSATCTTRTRSSQFESGSFVTDDLVELREDGEVVLTGRASDLINTAGKKVNPREVEQVILQIDGVRQVKVYGEPAGARGEVVAAAVVASPDVTREQIREFCRDTAVAAQGAAHREADRIDSRRRAREGEARRTRCAVTHSLRCET